MKELMEVDINKSTGSVFYRIGTNDEFSVSVRLWKGISEQPNTTLLGFRVRVTLHDNLPQPISMVGLLKDRFPKVKMWTGTSGRHGSVAGLLTIPVNQYNAPLVLAKIHEEELMAKLWETLIRDLDTFVYNVDKEQFVALMTEIAKEELQAGILPNAQGAVVLDFASHKVKYLGGKEVDTATEDNHE